MSYRNEMTEIIQFPTIRKDGKDLIKDINLLHLSDSELQAIARTVKGVVAYPKMRATYTEVEGTPICSHYGCHKLGNNGIDDCGQHS